MKKTLVDTLPHSPFKILMAHFKKVEEAVAKLKLMIDAYLEGDFTEASTHSVEISKMEHEADEIKRHLRTTIGRMILMPVSRQDVLTLLSSNERIADAAQDVAQILDMRKTEVPAELRPLLSQFVGHCVDAVAALGEMMYHMEHVLESTFARIETQEVIEMGMHVHEHEYKADSAGKQLSKAIYAQEGKVSPLAVVHMLRFSDVIDRVADYAENSANTIVAVVSK